MRQGKTTLIIGLIVGLLVGVVLGAWLSSPERRGVRVCGPFMETIMVANKTLEAGTVLSYDVVAQRDVPGTFVTSSVVRPTESTQVIGKVLRADMQQGDPILWSHVSDRQDRAAPSSCDAQQEAVSSDSGG